MSDRQRNSIILIMCRVHCTVRGHPASNLIKGFIHGSSLNAAVHVGGESAYRTVHTYSPFAYIDWESPWCRFYSGAGTADRMEVVRRSIPSSAVSRSVVVVGSTDRQIFSSVFPVLSSRVPRFAMRSRIGFLLEFFLSPVEM